MAYLLASLVFFVAALVAGAFGFVNPPHAPSQIAFFLFLVMFAVSLVLGLVSRR